MTRQPTGTVEAATEPLLVLQPSVSSEGTRQALRQRHEKAGSTTAITARRDRTVGCSHHWIIEAAMLPLSKGVCRVCGEEKLFRNQLQWAEIAPVRVINGRRQEKDITITPDQREAAAFVLAGSRYGSSTPLQSARREY
jgi:hypothetical protein